MSRLRLLRSSFLGFWLLALPLCATADEARVDHFSPMGTAKQVRQVAARFTVPMVTFGDPRLPEPFAIDCPEPGTGRWADARNWIYDFERDLPGGVACTFRLRADLVSLAGERLAGQREFRFDTGGPSVRVTVPAEGSTIDEEQVFILGLDAPAQGDSVREKVWCSVEGMEEKIGVRLLGADERRQLFTQNRGLFFPILQQMGEREGDGTTPQGPEVERMIVEPEGSTVAMVACQRRLPNGARVRLVWGSGVRAPSNIATRQDQAFQWRARSDFRATFQCDRTHPDAPCIPILPMTLTFSAPVPRAMAERIELRDAQAKRHAAVVEEGSETVTRVIFPGPFPEKSRFTLTLPAHLQDDAGRPLHNGDVFPLAVETDDYPPLAKFPARFGIIERDADAILPFTVRNIEAQLDFELLKYGAGEASGLGARLKRAWRSLIGKEEREPVEAQVLRLEGSEDAVIGWMKRLREAEREPGTRSLLAGEKSERLTVERTGSDKSFEVIGIPLGQAGFYVVELASPRLGAALLADPAAKAPKRQPYYVQTAALVTNMAVHFKHGRESSLVWVTRLDTGRPVADAAVQVRDCGGKVHWSGTTDGDGIARIAQPLPAGDELPGCFTPWDRHYFVTARTPGDFSFLFSSWKEGIEPWRFDLPTAPYDGPYIGATVFDRSLVRAGETVHMTHFYRRQSGDGFALVDKDALPDRLTIQHLGSDQSYEQPLVWDERNVAESRWTTPRDAKLGTYEVRYTRAPSESGGAKAKAPLPERSGGTFQVHAFRVPTLRAVLKPLATPLVNAREAVVDAQLNYLSGGGVGGATVKLRALVTPHTPSFADYEGFVFVNGNVREGRERVGGDAETESGAHGAARVLATRTVKLDGAGAARVTLDDLAPPSGSETPRIVQAEMEYADTNGEILTHSTRIPLWPAKLVIGLKPEGWVASRERVRFKAIALDLDGKPRPDVAVTLDLFQRTHFSHRKRLIGGFYGYENSTEVKRLGPACEGRTDRQGLLACEFPSPVSGNVVVRARAEDGAGNVVFAHSDIWVAGDEEWWFGPGNDDRMDVIPEKPRYEPGETAVFQVRMPFREATALVTVEREGVSESFVTRLTGKAPVVKVALKGSYAPNVFVSVLAVRGRVGNVQSTAMVDLGKPAYKLGVAQIKVGRKAHELKVDVTPDRQVYDVRTTSVVKVRVRRPDGKPARSGEVAFAAVDEGLLELMPNRSWNLLDAMMVQRGMEVETSTAQMQVVGRRHYGRKAVAAGGGGGNAPSRELFDTLLLWQGRVALDEKGEATIRVPINDALTSFRLVAVASAGAGWFGTGKATIRTAQALMLLPGLPSLVREGDRFAAGVTVRNASAAPLDVTVNAGWRAVQGEGAVMAPPSFTPKRLVLQPGEAQGVTWDAQVPANARRLEWTFIAQAAGAADRITLAQEVIPAVPVRTFQSTLLQLDKPLAFPVAAPADAIAGRGGIELHLRARLADELGGVKEYMRAYPYTCLEQRASQAVALGDETSWESLMNGLPANLDQEGLAKYFPSMNEGSDTLTAYLLTIADEAGWPIPETARLRMVDALTRFVEGRLVRHSPLATADLTLRKLSALNAIARWQKGIAPGLLGSITVDPNLWPTSAVLDWIDILQRSPRLIEGSARLREAETILRARLNFQGTTMGFSTERSDDLWWLMCSADVNASRLLVSLMAREEWREDMPRIARGAIGRQRQGRWDTTVANAWGTLAMARFSEKFESAQVEGRTTATLGSESRALEWSAQPAGGDLAFAWPAAPDAVRVTHEGSGRPWLTVQNRAAIPLKEPIASGYTLRRTVIPVEQKSGGAWSRGDVYRVRLDLEAQADMTWVVVRDPVPAGATILGTGLGGDSQILTGGEQRSGWVSPAFEERTQESLRAYYAFVPKGKWSLEYTVRLNNAGTFHLPATRVEALYAPESFGEIPNGPMEVRP